jgi:hypothetical protein
MSEQPSAHAIGILAYLCRHWDMLDIMNCCTVTDDGFKSVFFLSYSWGNFNVLVVD